LIRSAALENVACLVDEEVALNTAEARMSLQMWWRIGKRACQIHGLFLLLRAQKSKVRTLRERYASLVTAGKLIGALGFIQASRYDRIGCFLARFPLFTYQRRWTTVADWFEVVDIGGKEVALVDCLASIAPLSCVFLKDVFSQNVHGFTVLPGLMSEDVNDNLMPFARLGVSKREKLFSTIRKIQNRDVTMRSAFNFRRTRLLVLLPSRQVSRKD
jgi:hypothetical protein